MIRAAVETVNLTRTRDRGRPFSEREDARRTNFRCAVPAPAGPPGCAAPFAPGLPGLPALPAPPLSPDAPGCPLSPTRRTRADWGVIAPPEAPAMPFSAVARGVVAVRPETTASTADAAGVPAANPSSSTLTVEG